MSEAAGRPEASPPGWRRLLHGWQAVAARFGFAQTLVVLALFYAFLIGPTATGAALARRDWLAKRGFDGEGTAWGEADTAPAELERAKQPF